MKERIREAARLHRRSVNSEIVVRLESSLANLPEVRDSATELALHPALEQVLHPQLGPEEIELLRCYRALSEQKKTALMGLLS